MKFKPTLNTVSEFDFEQKVIIKGWRKTINSCPMCGDKLFQNLNGKKLCFTCKEGLKQKKLGDFNERKK